MSWFVDATMDSWFPSCEFSPPHVPGPPNALSVLEVVSTCSFWGPEDVLWTQSRCLVTWNQMKSLNSVFPLNSFRGPISLCIILGNFHQGFVQPTSHSKTVRHQQNIAIKKKAGGEAKVCFSRKLRWNSHKRLVVFVKSVGCLHSSFPIKLFKIPT